MTIRISIWRYEEHREELVEVATREEAQAMVDNPDAGTFARFAGNGPMRYDRKMAALMDEAARNEPDWGRLPLSVVF